MESQVPGRSSAAPGRDRLGAVSADGKVRTVETLVSVAVIVGMIVLGAFLIHLLNSQHSDRIAAFHYGHSGLPVAGADPAAPRKGRGHAGTGGTARRRHHRGLFSRRRPRKHAG